MFVHDPASINEVLKTYTPFLLGGELVSVSANGTGVKPESVTVPVIAPGTFAVWPRGGVSGATVIVNVPDAPAVTVGAEGTTVTVTGAAFTTRSTAGDDVLLFRLVPVPLNSAVSAYVPVRSIGAASVTKLRTATPSCSGGALTVAVPITFEPALKVTMPPSGEAFSAPVTVAVSTSISPATIGFGFTSVRATKEFALLIINGRLLLGGLGAT